ncbi:MAG: cytochrome c oxidase assembly protein [Rhodobacteraceae bacterium]|nr:cytochrome c oxidase assembly protein [Paracoccaceae bacterium]
MNVAARNRRTLVGLSGVILMMGIAVWASVPLYTWFCQVTGFGGNTLRAESNNVAAVGDSINVRFDASVERSMPWEFRPAQREVEIAIGESVVAHYTAHNPTNAVIAGSASYNVFPFAAGSYFVKIECFCFEQQVLQPGQTVEMPLSFYVDPEMLDDPETRSIGTVTLSYTFHRTELPEGYEPEAKSADLESASTVIYQDG